MDFCLNELGVNPTVTWMLDAFGHSSGISHLYAEMGMTETVFTRMNYDEIDDRE